MGHFLLRERKSDVLARSGGKAARNVSFMEKGDGYALVFPGSHGKVRLLCGAPSLYPPRVSIALPCSLAWVVWAEGGDAAQQPAV